MFFKLAVYEDSCKISDKLVFGPDWTIFFGVTCPWAMKIYGDIVIWMITTFLLSQSSSVLQVTRTAIKSWMSSSSVTSRQSYLPLIAEKAHIWPCPIYSAFNFALIFIKLAGNQDSHKFSDEFEFLPNQTFHLGVACPWELKKPMFDLVWSIVPSILIGSSSNLQVARTLPDDFEFQPDQTIDFCVTCPWMPKISSHILIMVKMLSDR